MQLDRKIPRGKLVHVMPSTGLRPTLNTAATAVLRKLDGNKKPACEPTGSVVMSAPPGKVRSTPPRTKFLKPKGIPKLHWTTVHSSFGNRDRSGSTSSIVSSRWLPSSPHMARAPCSGVISTGLFDPTLKSNQLQADERSWRMLERRKLRKAGQHSNSIKGEGALTTGIVQKQPNNKVDEKQGCHITPHEGISQDGTRRASLAKLLLSCPTFRETLGIVAPR